ncbi:hypothetical protein LOTGIDRAFT_152661 [Lottia gigantea]|uniref:CUB domain-containing protein n=1 Tax=Lottia gigantea TaxID=225164 RepID=V4AUT8_LOTGI|nr:hypothetical protein LOTGIDRAFT_152661 [Lottia gigantea]ESO97571.1 hypothetical protein LOTGIDRAFT_152661 [Lottia gigantea]
MSLLEVFVVFVNILFVSVHSKLCPVPDKFIGDVCGAVVNLQTGVDIFLGVQNGVQAGSCHCQIMFDGEPMTGKIRMVLFSSKSSLLGNHCPGMKMNFTTNGQKILQMNECNAEYLAQSIPVQNTENKFELHVFQEPNEMNTESCFIIGFRGQAGKVSVDNKNITAICSRNPDNPVPKPTATSPIAETTVQTTSNQKTTVVPNTSGSATRPGNDETVPKTDDTMSTNMAQRFIG